MFATSIVLPVFPASIGSNVQTSQTLDPASGDPDPAGWRTQADDYGRDFGAIYDAVFPMDDAARAAADRLFGLGTAVVRSRLTGNRPGRADAGVDRDPDRPSFAEFGVGSGRVALPLALRGGAVTGVDRSPELLASAARRAAETGCHDWIIARADIRDWVAREPADVAYCICATLSMLEGVSDQRRVLRNMRRSIGSHGFVVIETHHPDRVRALHRTSRVVEFDTAVPGLPGGLHSRSVLAADGTAWGVRHTWNAPEPGSATEFSRLIDPEDLVALAAGEGLALVSLESGWSSQIHDPMSPTYVAVFRPARADPFPPPRMAGPVWPADSGRTP